MQCVYTFVRSLGYLNDLQTQALKKHQDSPTYIKEKTKKQSKRFLPQYVISNIYVENINFSHLHKLSKDYNAL